MCKQGFIKCLRTNCDNVAQLLPLRPCERQPDCERTLFRAPRNKSAVLYCPNCQGVTRLERKRQTTRDWQKRNSARSAIVQVDGGNAVEDSNHAGVEHLAESSATGAGRGAFGGVVLSHFDGTQDTFTIDPQLLLRDAMVAHARDLAKSMQGQDHLRFQTAYPKQ